MGSIGVGSLVGYRSTVVGKVQRVKKVWERHFDFKNKFDDNQKLIEVD